MSRNLIILSALFFWGLNTEPLNQYSKTIRNTNPPQIILVLGGDIQREKTGMRLANALDLPIIVSGGSNTEYAHWLLENEGIPSNNATLDYRAVDTITNFTSIINDIYAKNINHAILVTSKDHLQRANIVGAIISGSKGIKITTIPTQCEPNCLKESFAKQYLDYIRAFIWVLTGYDLKQTILE